MDHSNETIRERIAVLEARTDNLTTSSVEINDKLDSIIGEMTKYKGFLGGIAFIVSGVWVAVNLFKEWIMSHL